MWNLQSIALHSINCAYVQGIVVGRKRSVRARGPEPRDAIPALWSTKFCCKCYYCWSILSYKFNIGLHISIFVALLQNNGEKLRLLRHACLSMRPHRTERRPLDGFSWRFAFTIFTEVCLPTLVSIGLTRGCKCTFPYFSYLRIVFFLLLS
jgi:hypothetical protein